MGFLFGSYTGSNVGFPGSPPKFSIFTGGLPARLHAGLNFMRIAEYDEIVAVKVVEFVFHADFLIRHAAGLHPSAHAPGAAALNDAAVFLFAAPGQQRDPGGALYGFRPDIFGAGKQGCWDIDEFHN